MLRSNVRVFLLAVANVFVWAVASHAQSVDPTLAVIEMPRDQGGITLVVNNTTEDELPVVFEIFERYVAEDGAERSRPAEDSFLVFPPQAVIAPGASQAVRVRWLDKTPPSSRAFTFFSSQQPVAFTRGQNLQVVTRMGATIHVTDRDAEPDPVIVRAQAAADGVRVTIGNNGDRYFYINDIGLRFANREVPGEELAAAAGRTLVPPGGRRTFVVSNVSGAPRLVKR